MSDLLKTLIFLIIFLGVVPGGAIIARTHPFVRMICFCLMVYFTSWSWLIHIAPIPDWTGTARGMALSMSDILSMIVLVSMICDHNCKVTFKPPGTLFYAIYFLFAFISVSNAVHVLQWSFEIVKMVWMYLFFVSAYNYLKNTRDLWVLIYTASATLAILFVYGVLQKYFFGIYQVMSTLPHQNSLSLYVSLFGALSLGVLLNEKTNQFQTAILCCGVVWSTLLILFTFSRGGLLAYFWGLAVVGSLSVVMSRMTTKKIVLSVAGILIVTAMTSYALPRIIIRFKNAPTASKTTRVNLNRAAVRIANDYVFGVGANNFSEYSGPFRDYAREQWENAKIWEDSSPYGGIVESVYLLVAAEFGWGGLAALLMWFLCYLYLGFRLCFYLRGKACVGIAIGCTGGMVANYMQSLIEWSLKQYANFYELMLIFAVVAVVWTERKSIAALSTQGRKS